MNRLRGLYGRLSFQERRKANPDQEKIDAWQRRAQEIDTAYWQLDWNDLAAIEQFSSVLRAELAAASQPDAHHTTQLVHAG